MLACTSTLAAAGAPIERQWLLLEHVRVGACCVLVVSLIVTLCQSPLCLRRAQQSRIGVCAHCARLRSLTVQFDCGALGTERNSAWRSTRAALSPLACPRIPLCASRQDSSARHSALHSLFPPLASPSRLVVRVTSLSHPPPPIALVVPLAHPLVDGGASQPKVRFARARAAEHRGRALH